MKMLQNAIKFNSGFYGIETASTGEILRADLIKWDGKRGTSYPFDVSGRFEYYIDAENNVSYSDAGGKNLRPWCPGRSLNAHCRHLAQIAAR
jgi:hypothetical protein